MEMMRLSDNGGAAVTLIMKNRPCAIEAAFGLYVIMMSQIKSTILYMLKSERNRRREVKVIMKRAIAVADGRPWRRCGSRRAVRPGSSGVTSYIIEIYRRERNDSVRRRCRGVERVAP